MISFNCTSVKLPTKHARRRATIDVFVAATEIGECRHFSVNVDTHQFGNLREICKQAVDSPAENSKISFRFAPRFRNAAGWQKDVEKFVNSSF